MIIWIWVVGLVVTMILFGDYVAYMFRTGAIDDYPILAVIVILTVAMFWPITVTVFVVGLLIEGWRMKR